MQYKGGPPQKKTGRKGKKGTSTSFWDGTWTSLDSEKEHATQVKW